MLNRVDSCLHPSLCVLMGGSLTVGTGMFIAALEA